jgi:hypothetical protein
MPQHEFTDSAATETIGRTPPAMQDCTRSEGSGHIQPKTSVKDFDLATYSVRTRARLAGRDLVNAYQLD